MKDVMYGGQSFRVPNHYNYIAADVGGEVWAYYLMPEYDQWNKCYYSEGGCQLVGTLPEFQHPIVKI